MRDDLPPSLKRRGAKTTHAREEHLLNRFAVMRSIEAGVADPSSASVDSYAIVAEQQGMEAVDLHGGHRLVVSRAGVPLGLLLTIEEDGVPVVKLAVIE